MSAIDAHWTEVHAREAWEEAGREYARRMADPDDVGPLDELRARVATLEAAHVEAVRTRDAAEAEEAGR